MINLFEKIHKRKRKSFSSSRKAKRAYAAARIYGAKNSFVFRYRNIKSAHIAATATIPQIIQPSWFPT